MDTHQVFRVVLFFHLDTLLYVSKIVNQEQKCQVLKAGVLVYKYLKRNAGESGPQQSTAKLQNRTADIQHSSASLMLLLRHSGRTRRTM
jgi:hypothetical protein